MKFPRLLFLLLLLLVPLAACTTAPFAAGEQAERPAVYVNVVDAPSMVGRDGDPQALGELWGETQEGTRGSDATVAPETSTEATVPLPDIPPVSAAPSSRDTYRPEGLPGAWTPRPPACSGLA